MTDNAQDGRERLWSLVKKHRFAMMTTRQDGDVLRSRPMTTIEHGADDSLWFFAKADSAVAEALDSHKQVCLSYADPSKPDFVCVSGDAAVVTDTGKKRALWNKMVEAWFPEGPDAASVVLVEVTPDHAEYWDSNSNKLLQLFSYARAVATGRPPHDLGEHRDVPLSRRS